jgi:hypothetical protein
MLKVGFIRENVMSGIWAADEQVPHQVSEAGAGIS